MAPGVGDMVTIFAGGGAGGSGFAAWCCSHRSTIWLGLGVLAWWSLTIGLVAALAPAPTRAAQVPPGALTPGGTASIHAPPRVVWPIPNERRTFDDYWVAFHEDDEGALTEVLSRPEWFIVANCQLARVVSADGEAVQVEILDGPATGQRGWLKMWQLRPQCQE